MIIDRYACPVDIPEPALTDPILQELDWILDDPQLFGLVRRDLKQHYKSSRFGRHPIPVEVTLRMIVLRRLKKWTYRQVEQEVRDSPAYRRWVRVYNNPVPDHSSLNDLERLIRPKTLHRMNDQVMVLAQEYRITQGYRLRVDSSVTESNIHYPTDSSLLFDGVRVLSRLLKRAAPFLPATLRATGVYVNHTRSARRRARRIAQLSRPAKRETERSRVAKKAIKKAYVELIGIASNSLAQAKNVHTAFESCGDDLGQRVIRQLGEFIPLVEQAIDQAVRRVLQGETVPASAKVVSLFEPHTQIIRRGKAPPHETEFGHKVNYAEVEHGLISDWQVITKGNPPDDQLLPPILRCHRKRFGHAPRLLAADRGVFSPENENLARQMGIAEIAIPQLGHLTPERQSQEKAPWFKQAQRFRNGIEGRISVVRRTLQLSRCPYHGPEGFERWISWGILIANLVVIARALHKRRRRKRHHEK
jgi:IS5 family transposase